MYIFIYLVLQYRLLYKGFVLRMNSGFYSVQRKCLVGAGQIRVPIGNRSRSQYISNSSLSFSILTVRLYSFFVESP